MIVQLEILVINYLGVGLRKMANMTNQLPIETVPSNLANLVDFSKLYCDSCSYRYG